MKKHTESNRMDSSEGHADGNIGALSKKRAYTSPVVVEYGSLTGLTGTTQLGGKFHDGGTGIYQYSGGYGG